MHVYATSCVCMLMCVCRCTYVCISELDEDLPVRKNKQHLSFISLRTHCYSQCCMTLGSNSCSLWLRFWDVPCMWWLLLTAAHSLMCCSTGKHRSMNLNPLNFLCLGSLRQDWECFLRRGFLIALAICQHVQLGKTGNENGNLGHLLSPRNKHCEF